MNGSISHTRVVIFSVLTPLIALLVYCTAPRSDDKAGGTDGSVGAERDAQVEGGRTGDSGSASGDGGASAGDGGSTGGAGGAVGGSGGSDQQPPYRGFAAPGTAPDVPGPSTRILQPQGSVLALSVEGRTWLYVNEQSALWRIPIPVEDAETDKAGGELIANGRVRGTWVHGNHIYWVDLDLWELRRVAHGDVPSNSSGDVESLPIGLPRAQGETVFDVAGAVHGDVLYLAKPGCSAIARIDLAAKTATSLSPWPPGTQPAGPPSLVVTDGGVHCLGAAHVTRTLWRSDLALTSAASAWTEVGEAGQVQSSISGLAEVGGAIHWIFTPGPSPAPSIVHELDSTGRHSELVELTTQLASHLQADGGSQLYWQSVDAAAREVIRVLDLSTRQTHDVHADFGLIYTDAGGEQRRTHLLRFVLAPDHVYWVRGNPGSRPGAGDDIMRLPRSALAAN